MVNYIWDNAVRRILPRAVPKSCRRLDRRRHGVLRTGQPLTVVDTAASGALTATASVARSSRPRWSGLYGLRQIRRQSGLRPACRSPSSRPAPARPWASAIRPQPISRTGILRHRPVDHQELQDPALGSGAVWRRLPVLQSVSTIRTSTSRWNDIAQGPGVFGTIKQSGFAAHQHPGCVRRGGCLGTHHSGAAVSSFSSRPAGLPQSFRK